MNIHLAVRGDYNFIIQFTVRGDYLFIDDLRQIKEIRLVINIFIQNYFAYIGEETQYYKYYCEDKNVVFVH